MKKFLNKVEAHEVESGLDKLLKESKNIGNNPDVKPATEEISSVTGGDYATRSKVKVVEYINNLTKKKLLAGDIGISTALKYKALARRIEEFSPDIRFDNIDQKYCRNFLDHLFMFKSRNTGMFLTKSKQYEYMKRFERILNYAIADRIIIINPFDLVAPIHKPKNLKSDYGCDLQTVKPMPYNHIFTEYYVKRPNGELWNDVWFENELCIMYAAVDDVLSQSIFAVLIADELNLTDKVLIFDLAWVQHQLVDRYSDINGQHYRFSDNLYRFEHTNHYCEFCDEMETEIRDNLEFAVKSSGAKILIFDNLPDKCEFAYQMMQILINLKKKYGLSVLCLVRTPKRDMSVPIEYSEYTGSMALIDFCDSAVVIGKSSRGKSVRYVKQIKSRNNKIEYGSDNVVLYNIVKEDGIYLRFDFNGHGTERDHLVKTRKKNRQK